MLLQFSVTNFGTIRDKAILSLIPSSDKQHPENLYTVKKYKGNCITAIYGANASGKSTLFQAMTVAILYIRNSNIYQLGKEIPVTPFEFCKNPSEKPSGFEFVFVTKNGRKYVYGFSATNKKIVEEYLYIYNTSKPSMIFDRSENNYKFSRGKG